MLPATGPMKLVSKLVLAWACSAWADDESWETTPVVVAGTGGSGTRGVVAALPKMGIYMAKANPAVLLVSRTGLST